LRRARLYGLSFTLDFNTGCELASILAGNGNIPGTSERKPFKVTTCDHETRIIAVKNELVTICDRFILRPKPASIPLVFGFLPK
jgi:hypothetical protein